MQNLTLNLNFIKQKDILVASATRQGVSHKVSGTPCQDSILLKRDEEYTFLGLADGAGSAKHSDIGSKLILEFLSLHMYISFGYYQKNIEISSQNLLGQIHLALVAIAEMKNVDIHDLSSTLQLIAIYRDDFIIVHIGDGVIGILDENEKLSVLSHPQNGEYSHLTYFTTTMDEKNVRIYRGEMQNLKGCILMSDGVEESLYDYQEKTLAPISKKIIQWLDYGSEEEVSSALNENLKNIFAVKSSDDLSIALLRHHAKETTNY